MPRKESPGYVASKRFQKLNSEGLPMMFIREFLERRIIVFEYVDTKEPMVEICVEAFQTPLVMKFLENVRSDKCEAGIDLLHRVLMREWAELKIVLNLEGVMQKVV